MIYLEFVKLVLLNYHKQKIVEEYKDLFHYVSLIKGKLKKILKILILLKL